MKATLSRKLSRNRRARTWLLCGLLVCACFAATAWQYDRAVRQAQLNRNLLKAISSQQAADVQNLLRAGANPNTRVLPDTPPPPVWQALAATVRRLWRHQRPAPRPVYSTALLLAMGAQDVIVTPNAKIVQCLLDAGANPDAVGPMFSYREESNAPLVWAVQQDQPQIVRLLLDKHANVRAQDVSGNPCLSLAVAFNHSNAQVIAALLLSKGVDVNAHNSLGQTPLITAAGSEVNPALIKLLLDHGADVSARGSDGQTAFFKFIFYNQQPGQAGVPQVTKMLLDAGADVNDKDVNGITPLMQAAGGGNQAPIRLLLKHGAKTSLRDNKGRTALVHAVDFPLPLEERAWNMHLKTTTLLLNSGANINDAGFAKTLLASGVMSVDHRYSKPPMLLRLVHFLREHGADVNIKGSQGTTPLMICSDTEDPQAARLLLAQGADVNACDNYGQNALMSAANGGHLAVARLLLAHGADKSARDSKGRTALDRARTNHFDANSPFDSLALGQQFVRLLMKQNP